MNVAAFVLSIALGAASGGAGAAAPAAPSAPVGTEDLLGAWTGELSHEGETAVFALEIERSADEGKVLLKMSMPVVHVAHQPIAKLAPEIQGNEVRLGPFRFEYDAAAKSLRGMMPQALVPLYEMPVTLRRVDRVDVPPRAEADAPRREPAWTFEAGSPLGAGATCADGVVYAGGVDGLLHALDAATGKERWSFRAGGPIRSLATVGKGAVFVAADDGVLYAVAAADGKERWRAKVVEKPIVRLPFDDPKSRYDRFGSAVTVAEGRLYLGTHDGRLVAVDPADGKVLWAFASGDSVLAAPWVEKGRVYFGSFDGFIYALDAAQGSLVWKRDTRGAVVSTPAVDLARGRVVVGNRSYDLLGLDVATGEPAWKKYIWSSWVESSASLRDGVAYVGSSDAAALFAFDVKTGQRLWATDVHGWAWGQPAVTDTRVYTGTSATKDYLVGHRGGVFAVDRATGKPVWQYAARPAESGSYGFPGTAALGGGLVFLTGLDGKVYAFTQ
jgi:outer membrane protein assembly factor BamB